jgi:hypothetical protein
MIRTLLSLVLYGFLMFWVGVWAALHPADFGRWLSGRSDYIGHLVQHQCKTPSGWYACDKLTPVATPSPTP